MRRRSFDIFLGRVINEKRVFFEITQAELAEEIKITQGTLCKIEAGRTSMRADTFLRVTKFLDINIETIKGEMK